MRSALIALAVCIVFVAVAWTAMQVGRAVGQGALAEDFMTSVWSPGRALSEGESPMRTYARDGHDGGTVYPPIATLVTFPLSLPPYRVAAALWLAALVAAVFFGLWLCGVRDWRCYAAAFASPPVVAGITYANASIVLVLAVALVWRFRDRPKKVGAVLGLAVAAKLFLWPLLVWLALTRRWASLCLSIVLVAVLSVVGWAVIGFDELADYPDLMRRHAAENDQDGVSVAALAAYLGVSANQAVAFAAGFGALAIGATMRRDDLASFTWVLTAAILASPMVWTHYYALLLVPLALARPTWGLVWFVPFAFFPQTVDAVVGVLAAVALATGITAQRVVQRASSDSGVSPRLNAYAALATPESHRPRASSARTSSPA